MKSKIIVIVVVLLILAPLTGVFSQTNDENENQNQVEELEEGREASGEVMSTIDKVPEFFKRAFTDVYSSLESWRIKTLESIRTKKETYKAKIETVEGFRLKTAERVAEGENYQEIRKENPVNPLNNLKYSFYRVVEVIFSSKVIFYGIILLLALILIIRIFG